MIKKSNEDFQKDVLDILKQHGENLEGFKKEVKEKLEKKQLGLAQKKQIIDKNSGYSYMTNIAISSKNVFSQEEMKIKIQQVTEEMKEIMKKYKVSKLECFVVRDYE